MLSRCLLKNWTSIVDEDVVYTYLLRLSPAHMVLVAPLSFSVMIAYMKHLLWKLRTSCLDIPAFKMDKHVCRLLLFGDRNGASVMKLSHFFCASTNT